MPNSTPFIDAQRAREKSPKFLALCELSLSEQERVAKAAKASRIRRLECELRRASEELDVARRELRAA